MPLRLSVLVLWPLRLLAAAMLVVLLLLTCAWLVRGDVQEAPPPPAPAAVAEVQQLRAVSIDSEQPLVLRQAVDYSQGQAAAWWPTGQAPVLDDVVAQGLLPAVAQRVGPEPIVLAGVDGIGRHGGSWYRIANGTNDLGVMRWRMSGATLMAWSPQGYPIVPHMAKSLESNDDASVWTMRLRRGHRWSDGEPFDADDIMFWYEEEVLRHDQQPIALSTPGGRGRIERVDAQTLRFVFPEPNGLFPEALTREWEMALPEHYLRPYHPDLGDPALIEKRCQEWSLSSPHALYGRLRHYLNPEHPRLWPWIPRTYRTTPPYTFVRNPYYCMVDTAGNQLPYIDRLVFAVKEAKMIPIAAASGAVSFQQRNIFYRDHTLLMGNRERGGYEVYHWYPGTRSEWTIFPNVNRRVDPARPQTAHKARLLADKRFRQALSLAIDRAAIIQAEYNNQTKPAQLDPGPDSLFHSPELYRSYTAHNPTRAAQLLDELGLTHRDVDGMRMAADGIRLSFDLNVCEFTGPGPAQFVIDDWAAVGIRCVLRDRARPLFYASKAGFEHDFTVWTGESDFTPFGMIRNFVPTYAESYYAPRYGIWYEQGGMHGSEAAARTPGALAPPAGSPLRRCMTLWNAIRRSANRAEQRRLFAEIQAIMAEEVHSISICTPPPALVVVDRELRGVPKVALVGAAYMTPANAGMEGFYFSEPEMDPQSVAEVERQMVEIVNEVGDTTSVNGGFTEAAASGGWLATMLRTLVIGGGLLGLGLVALRHPFVLRRLLLMVPTLLIVSVVVFTIIQLPPGDFLTTRMTELRMRGDEAALQELEDKKDIYRYEDPVLSKYLRWVGLTWFTSFDAVDAGLLQGHLGYSMETDRAVNDIVGDRILLTVCITLGTVLFTWAVALSVGIYSAVRQYTFGDYLATFLAMIGMCVPNFLLAIVFISLGEHWFGVTITGLFSPAYAAMPGWSWAKVADLLAHIWLPIVVLGVSGTAGMMRIMRGNLLDELRKPYVTTARAKGLRPLRLLLKYPVRIALGPFVSGLGSLFPHLVSGSAIVAMVLALPTVGPLLIHALTNEDMYLAGSMLMVMSLLAICGTLVSDLLLLWLDPRIRMDQEGR